jgi:hypothetical protein
MESMNKEKSKIIPRTHKRRQKNSKSTYNTLLFLIHKNLVSYTSIGTANINLK